MIPLEYFKQSIDQIKKGPNFEGRKVFLHGTSKGAEACLLLASKQLANVDGLILISPSAYVWPSPTDEELLKQGKVKEKSSWSYRGNGIDFVPTDPFNIPAPEILEIEGEKYFSFTQTWYKKLKGEVGRIDLKKVSIPTLIFSGKDDHLWPSYEAGKLIQKELGDKCRHIAFDHVGHNIPYPGKPSRIFSKHPQIGINILYGGQEEFITKASNEYAHSISQFVQSIH